MLSVVICTKDRKNILLETLSKIGDPAEVKEIIVINDGADDLERELADYPVKVYRNKGKGAAAARNTGAGYAGGDFILFMDDDILVDKDHFARHLSRHQHSKNRIVTANRFYPDSILAAARETPFGRYKLQHEYNWLSGCNLTDTDEPDLYSATILASFSCSLSKELWEKSGGFNERFPYAGCEDNEFFTRARKAGAQLFFDKSNVCFHNELDNFTLPAWIKRQVNGIKGALIMCSIHPEGKEHPTYYLNVPVSDADSKEVKKTKRKRIMLSKPSVLRSFYLLVKTAEALRLPDKLLFRLYNAVWLGESKRSFMDEYRNGSY